jgi:hypothetical protein
VQDYSQTLQARTAGLAVVERAWVMDQADWCKVETASLAASPANQLRDLAPQLVGQVQEELEQRHLVECH